MRTRSISSGKRLCRPEALQRAAKLSVNLAPSAETPTNSRAAGLRAMIGGAIALLPETMAACWRCHASHGRFFAFPMVLLAIVLLTTFAEQASTGRRDRAEGQWPADRDPYEIVPMGGRAG